MIAAIQAELQRMCMGSAPDTDLTALPGLSLTLQPAANYIAALGLWQCLSHTWPRCRAVWDETSSCVPHVAGIPYAEITAHLLERAARNDWTAPLRETKHPLLGNAGRRSLLRGATTARAWLEQKLPPDEAAAELDWVLLGSTPRKLRSPMDLLKNGKWTRRPVPHGYWNLGTIAPDVLAANGSPYGNYRSAWLAVLAWEALPWLDRDWTERAIARPRLFDKELQGARRHDFPFIENLGADQCQWIVPVWHEPIELRRAAIWFRGRRRFTGRAWSRWTWSRYHDHPVCSWRTYGMRRLVSEQTWEYVSYGKAVRYIGGHWYSRYRFDQHAQ